MTLSPRDGECEAFGRNVRRYLGALARRVSGLHWLRLWEWSAGKPHVHAVLSAVRIERQDVRAAKRVASVRASVMPIRSVFGWCHYLFKVGRWSFKAHVVPENFEGKLISYSREYLVAPLRQLWREFRDSGKGVSRG